ncbi:MAG: type II secretion system secretin GspD [Myxococcota bacterium]
MPVALLLALLLLASAGSARAQDAPPVGGEMVTLDFQDAEITEVIGVIAQATGKNFLYDDRVRGRVTVISPEPVTADEAYRVFESILQVKGFTTVPSPGGILKIVPLRDAKENPLDTVTGDRPLENRDLFITRLIPLRFVKAEQISETIKPLVSKEASVISYAPTNTMIITDSAANIRRLVNIIDQIDVSTYQEQIKLIPIRYADAAALTAQLAEIFGGEASSGGAAAGAAGGRIRRARAAAQQAQQPQPGIPGVETVIGGGGEPRFIPDERTNAIVVIANKAVLREVERIIDLLDYQRKGSGRIHVYRLQNADAEEIAQTLSSLASGSGGGGARPATTRTSLSGAAGQAGGASLGGSLGGGTVADLGDGVRITADTPTNSLIIQASAEAFSTLSEVIEALDIRRPQVMVEALIMEVDVDDSQNLGTGWLNRRDVGDPAVLGIGSSTGASPSIGDIVGGLSTPGQFTTAIIAGTIDIVTGTDPNGVPIVSTVPTIQAIITAAQSDSDTNIISAPTILTADNEEAEIVVGQNIPVPTSRLQATSTTTDPNNPFQTSQNIAREDVGVTLRVTPQISEGDTVRLNIFQEISEVQSNDSTLGPTTTNRKVENVVYVRDGEAVMIGGILAEVQGTTETKVPWLGDIPILGWAFKGTSDTVRKTNLLVVLTPRIVRSPEDLERVTVEGRERFRDASRDQMALSEEEEEERRAALESGIPLPRDPNPVRRELERHDQKYPVEQLPELRAQTEAGEQKRLHEMEALKAKEAGGTYLVQVAHFAQAESAVSLLQKLMGDGYDGSVLTRTEQGETTHWVQLGPYPTEAKAQAVARDVNATLGFSSLVIVEP